MIDHRFGGVDRRVVAHFSMVASFVLAGIALTAQESVQISLPAIVSFEVLDVGVSTAGNPSPTTISFDNASLTPGRALRLSVKAEGDFTPPSGTPIPASNVSWTTSNALNGVGINGMLSATAYNSVFESQVGATSGGLDVSWTLSAPGTPLHAGNHQVTLRWKLEAMTP
jgi:hypothetical protein